MATEFRRLKEEDFADYFNIVTHAYTGVISATEESRNGMEQTFRKIQDEEPSVNFYGAFRHGKLVGVMRLHDFVMTFLSRSARAGGIGQVAVDLLHKKERICKDIISFSLRQFREQGYGMAMLYPFSPSFYKKMGFGYGTKINQYRVRPEHLPAGQSKTHLRYGAKSDKDSLLGCYNRHIKNINGMVEKSAYELDKMFDNAQNNVVIYEEDDVVRGYIVFKFEPASTNNFLLNDIHVGEMVYEDRKVLAELLAFLHSQSDQIREIIFDTQDEFFHHLLTDVVSRSTNLIPHVFHESNVQGVGIMYKVIDLKTVFGVLRYHNFNNQTCRLKLTVHDSLLDENNGSVVVFFEDGGAGLHPDGPWDVELSLDVSDFSSLLIGVISWAVPLWTSRYFRPKIYRLGKQNLCDWPKTDVHNQFLKAGAGDDTGAVRAGKEWISPFSFN